METANHHILETVGLNACPVLHLIRRNILRIASHVVRCIGIRTLCTDGRHEFVVFVRNEIFGSNLRHTVDFMIGFFTRNGVSQLAVSLETLLNLVQKRSLCFGIVRAVQLRSLEHDVLEIVSQSRRFSRVVSASRANGDVSIDTRCLLVHREINFQPVRQRVDACLHQVTGNGLILVILRLRTHSECQKTGNHP